MDLSDTLGATEFNNMKTKYEEQFKDRELKGLYKIPSQHVPKYYALEWFQNRVHCIRKFEILNDKIVIFSGEYLDGLNDKEVRESFEFTASSVDQRVTSGSEVRPESHWLKNEYNNFSRRLVYF